MHMYHVLPPLFAVFCFSYELFLAGCVTFSATFAAYDRGNGDKADITSQLTKLTNAGFSHFAKLIETRAGVGVLTHDMARFFSFYFIAIQ